MPFDTPDQPASYQPSMLNEAKISLSQLPPNTKPGDEVTLKVKRVDAASKCAYLSSSDSDDGTDSQDKEEGSDEGSDQDQNGTGAAPAPAKTLGTDLTLGPLGKLKNYLAKTSVDTQNQI